MNKVILIGRLTRDPDLHYTGSGNAVTSIGLATDYRVKKGDQWESKPEFHSLVAFGGQGETAAEHLVKGQRVAVEGRLQTRSYEDKQGQKKYSTEVVVERLDFLDKPRGSGSQDD